MNRKEFEEALMSTIVEYISDQVILRYAQACKKATVLFSGALIGYKDAVTSLNELKKDGWTLTAVLSKAAGEVITEERIRNDIGPDAIYVEGAPVNGRQIVDDSQFVIIPSLTINTAAKVANCISDNLLTNMISRAMATGKPIVAAIDGCCRRYRHALRNPHRRYARGQRPGAAGGTQRVPPSPGATAVRCVRPPTVPPGTRSLDGYGGVSRSPQVGQLRATAPRIPAYPLGTAGLGLYPAGAGHSGANDGGQRGLQLPQRNGPAFGL